MGLRVGALLGCLLLIVSCGEDSEPQPSEPNSASDTASETAPTREADSPQSTGSPSPHAADGTKIVVDDSEFGAMLFDDSGQAIYLFDVETTAEPQCYDDCATAWPPVLTDGAPVAVGGVDPALLGTTKRADGQRQVTYNDHPLYFYAHEGKNEVLCHDVFLNGGNWYVVQPDGEPAPPG